MKTIRSAPSASFARSAVVTVAAAAAFLGCSDPTGPEGDRVKGIIAWVDQATTSAASLAAGSPARVPTDGKVDVIQAPDEVTVGQDFTATITTVGASGCWEADGAMMELEPRAAEITPWDLDRSATDPEPVCTAALEALPRDVTLRFTEPGEAVIRVLGRRVVGGDLDNATDEVVEQRVQVVAAS